MSITKFPYPAYLILGSNTSGLEITKDSQNLTLDDGSGYLLSSIQSGKKLWINKVFVAPDKRNLGLAKALLQRAIYDAINQEIVCIEGTIGVPIGDDELQDEEHLPSEKLAQIYKKMGFTVKHDTGYVCIENSAVFFADRIQQQLS